MRIIICLAVLVTVSACSEQNSEKPAPSAAPVMNNSGYKVHIDPATGEFLPSAPPKSIPAPQSNTPENQALPSASSKAKSQNSEPVRIIPSDVPGGGEMIELKGRFLTDEKSK